MNLDQYFDKTKNAPEWFNDITNEYVKLDMHGFKADKVKVTDKEKNTFKNIEISNLITELNKISSVKFSNSCGESSNLNLAFNVSVAPQTSYLKIKSPIKYNSFVCLDNTYDLGNKYLSEAKFTDAENTFKNIQKFDSSYKDTSKKLVIAVNEPLYLRGVEEFSNKKYIASYQTWNRIASQEPNYKDIKNKLQQALNERYKEGNYFLMQPSKKQRKQTVLA